MGVLFQVLKGFLEPDVVRVGDVDGQLLLEEESKKIGQLYMHTFIVWGRGGGEGGMHTSSLGPELRGHGCHSNLPVFQNNNKHNYQKSGWYFKRHYHEY